MSLFRGFKKGPPPPPAPPDDRTRIITRSDSAAKSAPATGAVPGSAARSPAAPEPRAAVRDDLTDLIVGWLVIVAGPGRGKVLPLGYGVNDIGRSVGARVRLDFGDAAVAPTNHAAIIYTARSRCFYLAQSVDAEIWLNGHPVRKSVELTGAETLRLGQTHLRFVPLCGPDFDWRESD
ncbi:MAG: FHA domain-containing protein [Candidatus Competibacter sp.]|nr:FHA domain-containing protein [Candidatus Competibacter sp.]